MPPDLSEAVPMLIRGGLLRVSEQERVLLITRHRIESTGRSTLSASCSLSLSLVKPPLTVRELRA
jgi:hypothetical protein